jgi:AraC-like DNA-binding protein
VSGTIPLIRAGSIAPFLGWMHQNGVAAEMLLHEADLSGFDLDNPDQPIPLLSLFRFACLSSRVVGPDLPTSVITRAGVTNLGTIGWIALGGSTIRDALTRAVAALPYHITYEMMSIRSAQDGVVLRESWAIRIDDETRHIAQQYVAALIQSLCDPDGTNRPVFTRMVLVAHPVHGIAHLRPHFGDCVFAAGDKALELHIPGRVLDRPCRPAGLDLSPERPPGYAPLPLGKDGLVPSAKVVLDGLLANVTPTIQQFAAAGGQSVRTFQRRLAEEGTTFSQLVDEVRRARALAGLAAGHASAADIAAGLGYKRQSSLTRAVRRWSGATPRAMRSGAAVMKRKHGQFLVQPDQQ